MGRKASHLISNEAKGCTGWGLVSEGCDRVQGVKLWSLYGVKVSTQGKDGGELGGLLWP